MADKVCTRFIDDDGLDVGCHLISKEYVLENYPDIVPWMKAPALWIWGTAAFGQLGNNTSTGNVSSPIQTISSGTNWKQISAGAFTFSGIKTDGTLWLWGCGYGGALGDNTTAAKSSPVQTISGGTNWKQVSNGGCVTGAIKTDGTLWTWGSNGNGQLGDNTTISKSSPVQTIAGGNNWARLSTGGISINAIKTDGTLWSWGSAAGIGDNTYTSRSSPVQVAGGGNNWKKVSAGTSVAAIKDDGTLWMWGTNGCGQLGDNTIIPRSSPVQEFSGGTNWKHVGTGGSVTAAIKTDGTLWFWGSGYQKFAGTADIDRSTPFQITSGGTNWKEIEIASLGSFVAAIKTDGTLWTWGTGPGGPLGNNSTIGRSSPVQTVSGGTDWRSVALSTCAVGAIRDEGDF